MATNSAIEWTEVTWNPITGCDRVSRGLRPLLRADAREAAQGDGRSRSTRTTATRARPGPGFGVTIHPDALDAAVRWRTPAVVFVNSMSDLFHARVPLDVRPRRLRRHARDPAAHLPGADEASRSGSPSSPTSSTGRRTCGWASPSSTPAYVCRIDHLRATCQPRSGSCRANRCSVRLPSSTSTGIDWVIAGGESGPDAPADRPGVGDATSATSASRQASPFFFKQWGGRTPEGRRTRARRPDLGRDASCRGQRLAREDHKRAVRKLPSALLVRAAGDEARLLHRGEGLALHLAAVERR